MDIKMTENRIKCLLEGKEVGYIDYEVDGTINAKYIFVKPDYRDTNAKNMLLDKLMNLSDELDLKIDATCSYMYKWFTKNKPNYLK